MKWDGTLRPEQSGSREGVQKHRVNELRTVQKHRMNELRTEAGQPKASCGCSWVKVIG